MRITRMVALASAMCALPVSGSDQALSGPGAGEGTLIGRIMQTDAGNGHPETVRTYLIVLPVRLCSSDRVIQTQSDGRGTFAFIDVPTGKYDLVTGGKSLRPQTVQGIEIRDAKVDSASINLWIPNLVAEEPCFRDAVAPCLPTSFKISYAWNQANPRSSASLRGRIINRYNKNKPLTKALVNLSRRGETKVLYSATSDKTGNFQIAPEPGVYDLIVSHEGCSDVRISSFLIPRENDTYLDISTVTKGAMAVCVD